MVRYRLSKRSSLAKKLAIRQRLPRVRWWCGLPQVLIPSSAMFNENTSNRTVNGLATAASVVSSVRWSNVKKPSLIFLQSLVVNTLPSRTTSNHAAASTGLTFTQPSLLLTPPSTLFGISSFLLAWSHHHEHFLRRRQMVEQKMAA
jgi:hypothetical protein